MEKENSMEFKVYGRRALFSDPITRIGGEKFSYQIPTYQALKGIAESIYWKPTFIWYIDKVRNYEADSDREAGNPASGYERRQYAIRLYLLKRSGVSCQGAL